MKFITFIILFIIWQNSNLNSHLFATGLHDSTGIFDLFDFFSPKHDVHLECLFNLAVEAETKQYVKCKNTHLLRRKNSLCLRKKLRY